MQEKVANRTKKTNNKENTRKTKRRMKVKKPYHKMPQMFPRKQKKPKKNQLVSPLK